MRECLHEWAYRLEVSLYFLLAVCPCCAYLLAVRSPEQTHCWPTLPSAHVQAQAVPVVLPCVPYVPANSNQGPCDRLFYCSEAASAGRARAVLSSPQLEFALFISCGPRYKARIKKPWQNSLGEAKKKKGWAGGVRGKCRRSELRHS